MERKGKEMEGKERKGNERKIIVTAFINMIHLKPLLVHISIDSRLHGKKAIKCSSR